MAQPHDIESARLHMLEARKALEDYETLNGFALSSEHMRLTQVFTNILDNAAKYTEPGGEIRIEALEQGGEAKIVVSDNGQGIAPDLLPRLFNMFVQGDSAAGCSRGGMGLPQYA